MSGRKKPNILLITADQWRADCVAARNPHIKTPFIDRLMHESVIFKKHYCGSAPCSPSRAGLYTGLFQMNHRVVRNGTPLDNRFDNIARLARRAGYEPTLFGYTDIAADPRGRNLDDPALTTYEGVLDGFTARQPLPAHEGPWIDWLRARKKLYTDPERIHEPRGGPTERVTNNSPLYSGGDTQTVFLADAFIDWIEDGEASEPWFAHISFLRPHPPFIVPPPYNLVYKPEDGPPFARNSSREEDAEIHPYVGFGYERQKTRPFLAGTNGHVRDLTVEDFAQLRAIYYGMVSEVDYQLSMALGAVRRNGMWDDTIVILTSDHGEMMGDHWFLGKGGFFDGSYHIPLIIKPRDAGRDSGRMVDRYTLAADIVPTIADILDEPLMNAVDGRSLVPLLAGEEPNDWRNHAFWEYDFRSIAHGHAEEYFGLPSQLCNLSVLRDDDFKYVHFAGLPPVLFDLQADPHELVNVAEVRAFASVRLDYAERLLSLRAQHLDQTLANVEYTPSGPVAQQPSGLRLQD
ncbi:MAG: phosphonate monoester hydrolase [Hyphomicrobiales bacterium]|nr:MAG: phosphonate monoester hydrolase [Hyphomicrobiales bacterium]